MVYLVTLVFGVAGNLGQLVSCDLMWFGLGLVWDIHFHFLFLAIQLEFLYSGVF